MHPGRCQGRGLCSIIATSLPLNRIFSALLVDWKRDPALILADYGHHTISTLLIMECLLVLGVIKKSEVVRNLAFIINLTRILFSEDLLVVEILLLIFSGTVHLLTDHASVLAKTIFGTFVRSLPHKILLIH